MVAYLKKNGTKVTAKELGLKRNSKTDAALKEASDSNRYDDALTAEINEELATYQTHLKQAYDGAKGQNAKKLLATAYNSLQVMVKT